MSVIQIKNSNIISVIIIYFPEIFLNTLCCFSKTNVEKLFEFEGEKLKVELRT